MRENRLESGTRAALFLSLEDGRREHLKNQCTPLARGLVRTSRHCARNAIEGNVQAARTRNEGTMTFASWVLIGLVGGWLAHNAAEHTWLAEPLASGRCRTRRSMTRRQPAT